MATYKFLIKTPEKTETLDAIKEILEIPDGNRLVITTGYIGGKDKHVEFHKLIEWLQFDSSRHLTLIFGVRGFFKISSPQNTKAVTIHGRSYEFIPDEGVAKKLMEEMGGILNPEVFPRALYDQISIYGVCNFHAKAMCLSFSPPGHRKPSQTLAAIIGSSNLTDAALYKPFGFEMDFFIRTEKDCSSDILESFRVKFDELFKVAFQFDWSEATKDFVEKTIEPLFQEEYGAMLELFENQRNPPSFW